MKEQSAPSSPLAPSGQMVGYESDWLRFLEGDAITVLRSLSDRSVNCCVTSPPYWGLRDYGIEASVWGGDPSCEHVFDLSAPTSETNYVDKRRWQHTRNGRDELQPPEKRVGWQRVGVEHGYLCQCGAWRGTLGLEPTPKLYVEHIVAVFREVRRVLRDDGTLWLNLGDCYHSGDRGGYKPSRVKAEDSLQKGNLASDFPGAPNRMPQEGLKDKDLVGIPWMVAFALRDDGWWLRSDIVWSKPNPMPESVTDRPTKAHEYLFLLSKNKVYAYNSAAIREADSGQDHSRHVVEPIYDVTPDGGPHSGIRTADGRNGQGRNKRSVWEVPTESYPEAHFATFPTALIAPCIKAGCPVGGVVLDPFLGSGTTAKVAYQLARKSIGIDRNPAYLELARKRCNQLTVWEAMEAVK